MFIFKHSMEFWDSPLGNNQYEKIAIRMPRESFCKFINTYYRRMFMKSMKEPISNLPNTNDPDEDLCKAFESNHDVTS